MRYGLLRGPSCCCIGSMPSPDFPQVGASQPVGYGAMTRGEHQGVYARLRVVPPGNAAAKNSRANEDPTDYTGNSAMPNPPAQYDLFGREP
jgi:hypothetical protein